MSRIVTIGVYGFTAGSFLGKLTDGGVGLLLDVRQRRGVRGPDYSWANSARLQHALAAADIGYRHVKELAPGRVVDTGEGDPTRRLRRAGRA